MENGQKQAIPRTLPHCQANHIYRYALGYQNLPDIGSDCETSSGFGSGRKLLRILFFSSVSKLMLFSLHI